MAAKDFFDSLEARADPAKLAGMTNSYLFEIEDEGQWLVTVADGKLTRRRRRRRGGRDDHRVR